MRVLCSTKWIVVIQNQVEFVSRYPNVETSPTAPPWQSIEVCMMCYWNKTEGGLNTMRHWKIQMLQCSKSQSKLY